jgi:hypothetical protein
MLAIFRAVIDEVGTMEPTVFGPCIMPLKKRISSSNFLPRRSFRRKPIPFSFVQQMLHAYVQANGAKTRPSVAIDKVWTANATR